MLIAISGGIGSGKSTIAEALRKKGYPVYDTDQAAKSIIVHNPAVRSQVEVLFGSEVFEGDRYRTDLVARQVFADHSLLLRLNQVVHPAVAFDLQHWYKSQISNIQYPMSNVQCQMTNDYPCFFETALLYESGLDKLCDAIVEVTAPLEVRIERTMARDHASREQVLARIQAQKTDSLQAQSTIPVYSIVNDGSASIEVLAEQILSIKQA